MNKVYDLNEGVRRASWGAGLEDGAGRGGRPRPAEPEEASVRRDRGRDDGPVPPERLESGWITGEALPARPAAEWIAGETERAAGEAEWIAGETERAAGEAEWIAGETERTAGAAERTFGGSAPVIPAAEWIPGLTGQTQIPAAEPGSPVSLASGEMRWAERADRAFRRDSRRYDGGFYLY